MAVNPYDLDDNASEVVEYEPMRTGPAPVEAADFNGIPAGGRLKPFHEGSDTHRRDFILLRRPGQSPVKLSMAHSAVFKGLWRLWGSKRLARGSELGSSSREVAEAMGITVAAASSALSSLVSNEIVREADSLVGRNARTRLFTPLQSGIELLALAEHLGEGGMVQVGKKRADWNGGSSAQPYNLFHFARLLRGDTIEVADDEAL